MGLSRYVVPDSFNPCLVSVKRHPKHCALAAWSVLAGN